jgi:hypothetical protein
MIINELDVTADLLNDVLFASQGEEGIEITNVKLSDATAAGVRDIKHALVSQAMSAAFDTDGTSKGTVSAIEFGTLGENDEFVPAEAIDQNEKAVALQLTTDGIAAGTHVLVRFYEDGFENQALRYVGEWDGEPTGTTMLVVPADLGEGYVLTPGAYQIELYVNGVLTAATYDASTGTLTPNSALPEGVYLLTYSLTDAAGNEGAQSAALSITVDTTAPNTPTAAPDLPSTSDTGATKHGRVQKAEGRGHDETSRATSHTVIHTRLPKGVWGVTVEP